MYRKVIREGTGRFSGKVQEGSERSYKKFLREGTGRFSGNVQEGYQGRYRKVLRDVTGRLSGKASANSACINILTVFEGYRAG
jgi:hypothetical protein